MFHWQRAFSRSIRPCWGRRCTTAINKKCRWKMWPPSLGGIELANVSLGDNTNIFELVVEAHLCHTPWKLQCRQESIKKALVDFTRKYSNKWFFITSSRTFSSPGKVLRYPVFRMIALALDVVTVRVTVTLAWDILLNFGL